MTPDDAPDVRRVFDFDGRCSLDELHAEIAHAYGLDEDDHMYAFFMSGRFWDKESAYWDPRTEGRRADKALLFRLELKLGKSFAYLFDYGSEQRFTVTLVAVNDVQEALAEPMLVESVGEVLNDYEDERELDPEELAELVPLAEAFLDVDEQLDAFEDELATLRAQALPWELDDEATDEDDEVSDDSETASDDAQEAPDAGAEIVPLVLRSATAASALLQALGADRERFLQLDDWLLERAPGARLLDLPVSLALVGETERALEQARAMLFVDRELMQGDMAIILARAGRREEALAQVDANLAAAEDAPLVEAKAGDTYRALGDLPAAEAYYRRSLELAKTPADRLHALLRLVGCLTDAGRDAEAAELLKRARKEREPARAVPAVAVAAAPAPNGFARVGRNDPCPCGSGKKYKKCHGASS